MAFFARLEKAKEFWILLIISLVFFFLRLPSLFEPYWYGDEGIYQTIGIALRDGKILYREIWDNKPPLLYIVYALFSADQFSIRFLSLIFGISSIIAFFLLLSSLFSSFLKENAKKSQKLQFIITFIFSILFAIPLLEGNIANSENFMMLPILIAGLLIFKVMQKMHSKNFQFSIFNSQLFIAGFLLSFAFLFKTVAIFDFSAFFLFIFFIMYKNIKSFIPFIKSFIPLFLGFFIPIFATSIFFLIKGAFSDFFQAAFFQNVGYVGYGNSFIIPQGFLILKLVILFCVSLILFINREKFPKALIFITLWFSFSVFNAFFSGRPYTHYMLVLLPSFLIFLGFLLNFRPSLKTFYIVSLISYLIISSLILKNFNFYNKIGAYYQNFLLFITNEKSIDSYRSFFDRNTPRDYILAQFINTNSTPEDSIFIWGNNAQLYALTSKLPPGRFTVAYHITASKNYILETYKAFSQKKPRYVIITSSESLIFPLSFYKEKYTIENAIIYERTY